MAFRAVTVGNLLQKRSAASATRDRQRILKSLLEAADANGDGAIDFDEYVAAVKASGADLTNRELRQLFAIVDQNADG